MSEDKKDPKGAEKDSKKTPPEVERRIVEHIIKPYVPSTKTPESKPEKDKGEESTEDLRTKIDELNKELEGRPEISTEDYDKLIAERDDFKAKIEVLALKEFEVEKAKRIEQVKKAFGEDAEEVGKFDEMIKDPRDLKRVDVLLEILLSSMQKSKEEGEGEVAGKPAATKPKEGTPAKPPKSVSKLVPPAVKGKEFENEKELVDYYYRQLGSTNAEERKEAQRIVDTWRKLLTEKLRTDRRLSFAVVGCPRCEAGIKEGELCPYCGWGSDKASAKTLALEEKTRGAR